MYKFYILYFIMSSVEDRLILFAIIFVISLPISFILLKVCVERNSQKN